MYHLKITLAYDGTHFCGWQENGTGRSIEGTLCDALEAMIQSPLSIQGASRTDAGVHAHGQVAVVTLPQKRYSPNRIHQSLNRLLPSDLRIVAVQEVEPNFHPSVAARSKEYSYSICLGEYQFPHRRHHSWHCHYSLDLEAMEQARQILVGRHDFAAFCNQLAECTYDSTVRTLYRMEMSQDEQGVRFLLEADRFLFRMARNLVGTLVWVGRGRILPSEIKTILTAKLRPLGGVTAPAHGLTLLRVHY